MLLKPEKKSFDAQFFDLTPIIDVVFLLIIFFMLVCRFMAEEQTPIEVPDQIQTARSPNADETPLTITVLTDELRHVTCSVDNVKLKQVDKRDLAALITSAVNDGLDQRADKTVRLRCDKRIAFGQVKYVLAGISDSRAQRLDWAVLAKGE